MGWLAHAWAEDAPVADIAEFAILAVLAQRAYNDGTDAYPSIPTIARALRCDERTVKRRLDAMCARGLLQLGNQAAAAGIRADRRPKVYDLMIPHSWYSEQQLEHVNREREGRGLGPLTAAERPPIAKPGSRKARSDQGKPRKRVPSSGGVSDSPPAANGSQISHGVSCSHPHGVSCRHPKQSLQENQSGDLKQEDQNNACSASAPSPRQRGDEPPQPQHPEPEPEPDPSGQIIDYPDSPAEAARILTPEHLTVYGQSEKIARLMEFLETWIPDGLEPNDYHAIESMINQGARWQKILRYLLNEHGYDKDQISRYLQQIVAHSKAAA